MLKGMKPLPKALILCVIIFAPIAAYVKFAPQKPPAAPVVEAVAPTAVPAEAAAPAAPAPAPVAVAPAAPAPAAPPSGLTPAGGQDAGLNAVLNAGKK